MPWNIKLPPSSRRDETAKLHLTFDVVINPTEQQTTYNLEDGLVHNGVDLPIEEPISLSLFKSIKA